MSFIVINKIITQNNNNSRFLEFLRSWCSSRSHE